MSQKNKTKDKVPECCKGCIKWELFGKDCWVYWENKKECTMHSQRQ